MMWEIYDNGSRFMQCAILISREYPAFTENEVFELAREKVVHECMSFPAFPNVDLIIKLSAQMYEKKECHSNIIFIPKEYTNYYNNCVFTVKYLHTIELCSCNLRRIRKLLETVDESHCLAFLEGEHGRLDTSGIVKLSDYADKLVTGIRFKGHLCWSVYINNVPYFEYRDGAILPIRLAYNKQAFIKKFKNAFPDNQSNAELFGDIIDSVSILGHGTSIAIVHDSEINKVLDRLTNCDSGHGIRLSPVKDFQMLNESDRNDFFSGISKMDGGFLMTPSGVCYAIGCIFDGEIPTSFKGDIGRGSRYNSIKLFVDAHQSSFTSGDSMGKKYMGVVFSDDGFIDII